MRNSKLLQLLRTLSSKELKQFEFWLNADGPNEKLQVLFEYLCSFYPDFEAEELDKAKVAARLLPTDLKAEQKLRYLMSDLTQQVEQFLVVQELRQNEKLQNKLLLKAYLDRGLNKHFTSSFEKYKKKQNGEKVKDLPWQQHQLELEELNNEFQSNLLNHGDHGSITSIMDHLDAYYLGNKLKYACEISNYKNILTSDYEPQLMEAIEETMKREDFKEIPLVHVYYLVLQTLQQSEDESTYYNLVDYLMSKHEHFSSNDLFELFIYARNYCTKQINLGNAKFQDEALKLYKYLLEKDILLKDGLLWEWDYLNVSMISLRAQDFEYALDFIEKYKNKLREHSRQNAHAYCLSKYYFYTSDFEKCLELLRDVEFSDPYYYMSTKILLAKCYYEKEEIISLFALTDSFSIYLRRNKKISKYQLQNHLNFVKYVKKMIRVKMGSRMNPSKIKSDLTEIPAIVDRIWLNQKLDELISEQ